MFIDASEVLASDLKGVPNAKSRFMDNISAIKGFQKLTFSKRPSQSTPSPAPPSTVPNRAQTGGKRPPQDMPPIHQDAKTPIKRTRRVVEPLKTPIAQKYHNVAPIATSTPGIRKFSAQTSSEEPQKSPINGPAMKTPAKTAPILGSALAPKPKQTKVTARLHQMALKPRKEKP